jgi:hypothetical protein
MKKYFLKLKNYFLKLYHADINRSPSAIIYEGIMLFLFLVSLQILTNILESMG